MTLKQLWSILRGRRTNYQFAGMSMTYYPDGDPMGTTFRKLLEELAYSRQRDYDNDAHKERVQTETLWYVIQTMLEKLRDQEEAS